MTIIITITMIIRVPTTEEFQTFLNEKKDSFDDDKENKK